jgi:hypothetical protein
MTPSTELTLFIITTLLWVHPLALLSTMANQQHEHQLRAP